MNDPKSPLTQFYGILAVQFGFISQDALVSAIDVARRDKRSSLREILRKQGSIAEKQDKLLGSIIRLFTDAYGGNTEACLHIVGQSDSAKAALHRISDCANAATVDFVVEDRDSTGRPSVNHELRALIASIDRYTVVRPHAKGGLGQIMLAHDSEVNRDVALKTLQERFADNEDSRQRFLLEGEITGCLEHPGIVPVYGLGCDRQGRPYYVMRFVHGQSLKEAIEGFHADAALQHDSSRRMLEFRKLLRRFLDVCYAVQYAHSRGVVHRDLKPANVMLGKYGETLVVDWGLAKVVGHGTRHEQVTGELTLKPVYSSGSAETAMGSAVGTPAYMSPEQAAGHVDAIGTSSDIYSLGATLYCLLTNQPPVTGASLAETIEKVKSGSIPSPHQVCSDVPQPLDSICRKAMALKPADRYQSPSLLVDDIERWLGDEPVSCHREAMRERVGRWVRRHRTWVTAISAALILVTVVAVVASLLINKARARAVVLANQNELLAEQEAKARLEAVTRFKEARETVDAWLTGSAEALQYYPGTQSMRTEMLMRAAKDYERFAEQTSDDPDLELERGRTYLRLGDVHRQLLQTTEAESAYRKADTVLASIAKKYPDETGIAVERAKSRMKLGVLMAELGKSEQAEKAYLVSADELRRLVEDHPHHSDARVAFAAVLLNRGVLSLRVGNQTTAEHLVAEAIEQYQRLVGGHPGRASYRQELSTALLVRGQVLQRSGHAREAIAQYREAIKSFDALVTLDPSNPQLVQDRAEAYINLASAARVQGDHAQEIRAYRTAIGEYQALSDAQPDVPVFRENSALTRTDLGQALFEQGRVHDAEKELAQAKPILEELAATYPAVPQYQEEWSVCLDNLGRVLSELDRHEEAKAEYERAVAVLRSLLDTRNDVPQYRERWAIACSHLGQATHRLGDSQVGIQLLCDATATLEAMIATEPHVPSYRSAIATSYEHLGNAYREQGQMVKAMHAFASAAKHWIQLLTSLPAPQYLADAAWFFANCADPEIRQPKQAVEYARRAVAETPVNHQYAETLAAAYYRADDVDACIAALQHVHDDPSVAGHRGLLFMSMALRHKSDPKNAKALYDLAEALIHEQHPGNAELRRLADEAKKLQGKPEKKSTRQD